MAYGKLYECSKVVLLYPHHGGLPTDPILQPYSIARPSAKDSLFVATLDVTGPHRAHQTALGDLVLERLCGATSA